VARDYKRRTPRKRGKSRSKSSQGLAFLGAGFGLGVIASIVLYRMFAPMPPPEPSGPVAAAEREPRSAVVPDTKQAATSPPPGRSRSKKKLDFYELLPNYEVVVAESDERVAVTKPLEKIDKAGAYVLQAGSFRRFADADRRKAQLALRGIESQIQRVTIGEDETWHRVRVGPLTDLDRVNQLRGELRGADIDVMLLRVAE
jgi:cell division protein FtsN